MLEDGGLTRRGFSALLAWGLVVVPAEATAETSQEPLRSQLGLPASYRPIFSSLLEGWANVVGGRRRDATLTGLLTFGAEVDTEAAGWWPGGRFHLTGLGLYGGNISQAVGDAGIASNIAGSSTVRLFRAWYRQRLYDGDLDLKVGIVALDDDFMVLPAALVFLNSGFGTAQTEALNTPAPIYPFGSLGARIQARPHPDWTVKLGAYDGYGGVPNEHSHAGQLAWTRDGGAMILGEILWRSDPGGRDLTLGVGGFGHTGRLGVGPRGRGVGSTYLMIEHEVVQVESSTLVAFSHAALAFPIESVVVPAYGDAGLVLDGGAWRRPEDRLAVGAAWTAFGAEATAAQRAGTTERVSAAEAVVELTYEAALQSWLLVQPATQWHRRPRLSGRDALVLALRVTASL